LTGTWIGNLTISIPLFITLVFAFLTVDNPEVIDEYIEGLLVDYRFKVRNFLSPPPVPENIVIVAIDEKSLSEYGRWPWNRRLQAELIERVFADRPGAVAVDIFFPESESREADRALADVMEKHRDRLVVVLGFEVEENKVFVGEIKDVLYDHAIMRIEKQKYLEKIKHAQSFRVLLPPEPIASSATFGHTYSLHDKDGKLRKEYLFLKYGEEYFPSFALQAARIYKGIEADKVSIVGGTGVDLGGQLIPTDRHGRLHINYLGKERTFMYKSASDVLSGRIPDEFFMDKIVLIGTSAIATYDMKNTPFSANMPGVEKNATVIANIISGDFIKRSTEYVDLLIVIFAGIITLFIGRQQKAQYSVLMYLLLILLVVITSQGIFSKYGIRLNLFFPLMSVITSGTFIITYRYFIEERRAKDIRKMFSSYVTEKVVNELIKNPEMAKLGGERREITVLFSDIRGFTSFSEKNAPEEVVAMLNEFLGAMTEVIFRWEGTLDKFIGDAIFAFWGAPLPQENHAELALRCSVNMIKRLEELQQKWVSEGKVPLDIGIGINTGEVLVGNIGAEGKKMDYTVIGDTVNLGSRIESLTRKYNCHI
jgi:adenylate cyclase